MWRQETSTSHFLVQTQQFEEQQDEQQQQQQQSSEFVQSVVESENQFRDKYLHCADLNRIIICVPACVASPCKQ